MKTTSQLDILPMVLGLLGEEVVHQSWGTDALSFPQKKGLAFSVDGNYYGLFTDRYLLYERLNLDKSYLYDLRTDFLLSNNLADTQKETLNRLQKILRSYLECTVLMSHQTIYTD